MRIPTLCMASAIGLTLACGGTDNTMNGHSTDGPSTDQARTAVKDAQANETTTRSGTDTAHTDAEVQHFVMTMAADGAAEVELGRLAAARGVDKEVKQFGADMARDHERAGEDLKQIAGQLNIAVPAQIDDEHRALISRLSTLNGKAFDRAYMDAMVNGHQEVLALLESHGGGRTTMTGGGGQSENTRPAATSGTAEQGQQVVAEWAAKTAPIVQAHLKRAHEVQDRLSGSNAKPRQ